MLGECFRRGGRKSEMEKKDERIANLERFLASESSSWIGCQKSQGVGTVAQRRQLLDIDGVAPSRKRQCELLELSRISTHYKKSPLKDAPATEQAIEQLYEEDATIGRRRLPICRAACLLGATGRSLRGGTQAART